MISKWKIQVLNPSGEVQGDLSGLARNRSFVITRNRPEQIILVFDLDKIEHYARDSKTNVGDLLKEGVNEIHIWRGNEKVVSGQINYSRATIQSDKRIHEVRAIGWLGLLLGDGGRNTRSVQTFSATDQGAILWALIDHTQTQTNGNIGITEGTIEATVDRDRTYPIDKNIGDAIIEMTEVINGLDVEITPDKVFNVYKRIGEDRSYLIFEHPGGIKGLALEKNAIELVNYVVVRGEGNGAVQVRQVEENLASQSTYTLREKVLDTPDVSEEATLTEQGEAEMILARPRQLPFITLDGNKAPDFSLYEIGDSIKILVKGSDYFSSIANRVYRIEQITAIIDEDDLETVTLGLSI